MSTRTHAQGQAAPEQTDAPVQTNLMQRRHTNQAEDSTLLPSEEERLRSPQAAVRFAQSPDQFLDSATPRFRESRFNHDFSQVPVHTAAPPLVQTKLRVGQPGDRYEQEADRVAEAVMRMPEPGAIAPSAPPQGAIASGTAQSAIAKVSTFGSFQPPSEEKLQRQPMEAEEEEKEKQEEMLQAKELPGQTPSAAEKEEEEEKLQAKELPGQTPSIAPQWEARLNASSGNALSLPESVRAFMEPRFGHDFSQVRVHTNPQANRFASELNAQAFTKGQDIFFGSGYYQPHTRAGQQLLAHELTHVVQQTGGVQPNNELLQQPTQDEVTDVVTDVTDEDVVFNQQPIRYPESLNISRGRIQPSVANEQETLRAKQLPGGNLKLTPDLTQATREVVAKTEPEKRVAETRATPSAGSATATKSPPESTTETQPAASEAMTEEKPAISVPKEEKKPTTVTAAETETRFGKDSGVPESTSAQPEAVSISAEDPGQILEQLKNTLPTQVVATYAQAQTASVQALEKQRQQVQENIPEIPAPTGLPAQQSEPGKAGQKAAKEAAVAKEAPAGEVVVEKSEQEGSQYEPKVPEAPPAPPAPPTQLAGGNVEEEGQSDPALSQSAQNALESVSIDTSQVSTSTGERPNVDLTGEADPSQVDATQAQSTQQVQAAKAKAAQDINKDFGQNNIFPKESNETLKANKELSAVSPPLGAAGEAPALPGELVGGLNQSLSPFLREKIGAEQDKYKAGEAQFNTDSAKARADADQKIVGLNEETKQKQLEEQKLAQAEVAEAKQEWQTELDNADKDYREEAAKATEEQRQKIGAEKTKGEQEAAKHLEEAEQKAEAEKQKADQEATQKKEEAKEESGGFWGWVKSKAKALIDGLKQAVNFIYDNLRKAVKAIFEAAKQLAMAAIDLARQAIVGLIKAYGEILKGLVKVIFAAFPEIAKKITAKIDQAVNKAVQAVNTAADLLKKGVAAVLDFLANTLDSLLKLVQDLYNGIFTVIGMIITGEFAQLLRRIGNLIDAAKAAPPQFETAGYEELLGGNLDKPLSPAELSQAATAGISIPSKEGESTLQMGEASELPSPPWTEANVGIDAVDNNMELSPELAADLMQQTNGEGEVVLGESNDETRSMESIISEAAGPQQEEGEKQEQQYPDDGLSPRQRAEIKWQLMKQGIAQWWSENWPTVILGATAAIGGFIALNVVTGGAITAALPAIMAVVGPLFAGLTVLQLAGHVRDYLSKGWEGDIQGGGKSLAKGLAAGAIELISWLTFKAGGAALKGAKALAKGAKAVAKGGVNLAKKAAQAVIKGAKYIIQKGKVLFKGIAGSGIGKQIKKLQDLGKALLDRMRFKAFRLKLSGQRFRIEGLINPWVVIAEGKVVEVSEGTPGAFKVADDEFAALQKGIMDDESLKQAVRHRKGFSSNTQDLEDLLKRTDIPQDRIVRVRANLAAAIESGQVSPQELQTFISKLRSADSLDRFDQLLAEMHHPNRLLYSGAVAKDSRLVTGAKIGGEYDLGSMKVKIDPVSEADALYIGKDGVVHLDEVKNTANALRQKLDESPQQLGRMKDWRNLEPNREVRVVVESEEGWTTLFGQKKGQKSALQTLIDENVPLTLGDYKLSVAKIQNLMDATASKVKELGVPKNMSWKEFFEQMPTLDKAEAFLGVSLK